MTEARNKKKLEQEQQRQIQEMLNRPENQNCCDCQTRGPRWASVSIGCFLCIRCAGLHRKLGTHISKIKSTSLDVWTPEHSNQCQCMGNKKVNEKYLSRGNAPFQTREMTRSGAELRPTTQSNLTQQEQTKNFGNISQDRYKSELDILLNMGFTNEQLNLDILTKTNGNIQSAIDHLISEASSAENPQPQRNLHANAQQEIFTKNVRKTSILSRFPDIILRQLHSKGYTNDEENENALIITDGNVEKAAQLIVEWKKNRQGGHASQGATRRTTNKKAGNNTTKQIQPDLAELLFDAPADPYGDYMGQPSGEGQLPSAYKKPEQQMDIFKGINFNPQASSIINQQMSAPLTAGNQNPEAQINAIKALISSQTLIQNQTNAQSAAGQMSHQQQINPFVQQQSNQGMQQYQQNPFTSTLVQNPFCQPYSFHQNSYVQPQLGIQQYQNGYDGGIQIQAGIQQNPFNQLAYNKPQYNQQQINILSNQTQVNPFNEIQQQNFREAQNPFSQQKSGTHIFPPVPAYGVIPQQLNSQLIPRNTQGAVFANNNNGAGDLFKPQQQIPVDRKDDPFADLDFLNK